MVTAVERPTPPNVPPAWTTMGASTQALFRKVPARTCAEAAPVRLSTSREASVASPNDKVPGVAPAEIFSKEAKARLSAPTPDLVERMVPDVAATASNT